jgi:hypothetical protein
MPVAASQLGAATVWPALAPPVQVSSPPSYQPVAWVSTVSNAVAPSTLAAEQEE